jgi:hypothetical protein
MLFRQGKQRMTFPVNSIQVLLRLKIKKYLLLRDLVPAATKNERHYEYQYQSWHPNQPTFAKQCVIPCTLSEAESLNNGVEMANSRQKRA